MERNRNTLYLLGAVVVGSLIGAGLMVLFAPQSGRVTRGMLRDRGRSLKEKAVETAEMTTTRTGKAVGEFAQRAKDRANSLLHRGQEMVEEHKSNIEEEAKSKSVQYRD